MEVLMSLYRKTGKKKYLEPIPRAIAYFRRSQLSEGKLARFYELKTNRPLYFTKDYRLTYSSDDMPTHYAFIIGSRLDRIETQCRRLLKTDPKELAAAKRKTPPSLTPALIAQTRKVIDSMDRRGAWVEPGRLEAHKIEPESGVIDCRTFMNNISTLCRFLTADEPY
jgi:hypothetical protein